MDDALLELELDIDIDKSSPFVDGFENKDRCKNMHKVDLDK